MPKFTNGINPVVDFGIAPKARAKPMPKFTNGINPVVDFGIAPKARAKPMPKFTNGINPVVDFGIAPKARAKPMPKFTNGINPVVDFGIAPKARAKPMPKFTTGSGAQKKRHSVSKLPTPSVFLLTTNYSLLPSSYLPPIILMIAPTPTIIGHVTDTVVDDTYPSASKRNISAKSNTKSGKIAICPPFPCPNIFLIKIIYKNLPAGRQERPCV